VLQFFSGGSGILPRYHRGWSLLRRSTGYEGREPLPQKNPLGDDL